MLDAETKQYLDNLPDDEFIYLIFLKYGSRINKWTDCSKEEYEKYCGKLSDPISIQKMEMFISNMFNGREYRVIPYWNSGGGFFDQITKEPDGWKYQKSIGYDYCLIMGGDMIEYCRTRKCMNHYFNLIKE